MTPHSELLKLYSRRRDTAGVFACISSLYSTLSGVAVKYSQLSPCINDQYRLLTSPLHMGILNHIQSSYPGCLKLNLMSEVEDTLQCIDGARLHTDWETERCRTPFLSRFVYVKPTKCMEKHLWSIDSRVPLLYHFMLLEHRRHIVNWSIPKNYSVKYFR